MKLHLTIDTKDDELRQNMHSIVECSEQQSSFHSTNYLTTIFAACLPKFEGRAHRQLARSYESAGKAGSIRPGRILSWNL